VHVNVNESHSVHTMAETTQFIQNCPRQGHKTAISVI